MGKRSRAKFLNQKETIDIIKTFIQENPRPFIDISYWKDGRAGGVFVKIKKMTLDGPIEGVSFYEKVLNKDALLKKLSDQLKRISED